MPSPFPCSSVIREWLIEKKIVAEKLVPNPFLKNQNWSYLWINSLKFYTVYFIIYQVKGYRNIVNLSCRSLAFGSYKAFLKKRKKSGTSPPASFSAWFLTKNVSLVILKFHFVVAFTSWDIEQYVYNNYLLSGCYVTNFEIKLIFWIKPFFLHDQ